MGQGLREIAKRKRLLLVLDTSGSVVGAPLAQLLTAAEAVAEALRPDDRVGLVRGFTRDNPARAALAVRDMIRTNAP